MVNKHVTFAEFDSVPSKRPSVQNLIVCDVFPVATAELVMDPILVFHIQRAIAVLVKLMRFQPSPLWD